MKLSIMHIVIESYEKLTDIYNNKSKKFIS